MPRVSLLTPTYERHRFLPFLAQMIAHQDADLSEIEWVVVDDSATSAATWFDRHPLQRALERITYVHLPRQVTIGRKRNLTKTLAEGDFLLHMDDDDYYATNYITTVLDVFATKTKGVAPRVVGATTISLMYPQTFYLYETFPPKRNHTCGGILSYTQQYAATHHFPNHATSGEEPAFLAGNPVTQLTDAHNVYMAFVHAANTVPKHQVRRRATELRWVDVVQIPSVALFYLTLHAPRLPFAQELVQHVPTNARQTYGYQFVALSVLATLVRLVARLGRVGKRATCVGV